MKKCKDKEVYVVHDVILSGGETDEEKVEYGEHESVDDVKKGFEKEISLEKRRMPSKINSNIFQADCHSYQ